MADNIISTSNVWPYYAVGNKSSAMAGQENALGKDQFLTILIAQIKNQDPMSPMKDQDFIAQMAQFSSVEQLTYMAKSLDGLTNSIGLASSLIGKTIGWSKDENGVELPEAKAGIVDSITVRDGLTYAVVGDVVVPINRIEFVTTTNQTPDGNDQGEDEQ